jgi:hypothetical protein
MVLGFQFPVFGKKIKAYTEFIYTLEPQKLTLKLIAGGLLWHEKPTFDKRLSEEADKLTSSSANANISKELAGRISFTENRKLKTENRLKNGD